MKKQISEGIILSLCSQIISIIVGLSYTPFMIRALGQNEYGLYQLVQSVVNYLNLMNLGFNGAYIRYYVIARKKNDVKAVSNVNGMFMRVFLVLTFLCLAAGAVIYQNIGILGHQLTEEDYVLAGKLLIILVINLSLSFPNSLYTAFMSANECFAYQKAVGIILNIAMPALNIPLLCLKCGAVGVVSVSLFLTVIRLILNVWYCHKKLKMQVNMHYFDGRIFKELLGYTFFIFLSDIVDLLNSNVDKLLLGRIMGTIPVAVYSVGYNLRYYFTTLSWIIPEMFIPEANRLAIGDGRSKELSNLFIKVGKFNNYLLLMILSGFFLVGREFVHLWVGTEYDTAYYAALILMLAGYIPAVQTLGVNIQNAKNMHRMRSVVYFIVAVVNVAVSILLIKKWGVIGTCLGTFFAMLLGHGLFMNFYYYKKIKLNIFIFWKEMLKWLFPVLALTGVSVMIRLKLQIDSWLKLLLFAFCYGFAYILLLYTAGLNKKEKCLVTEKIKVLFAGKKDEL